MHRFNLLYTKHAPGVAIFLVNCLDKSMLFEEEEFVYPVTNSWWI